MQVQKISIQTNMSANQKNNQVNFRGEKDFKLFQEILTEPEIKSFLHSYDANPNRKIVQSFFGDMFEKAVSIFKNSEEFENVIVKGDDLDFRTFKFKDSEGNTMVVDQGLLYPKLSLTEIPNSQIAGQKEIPNKTLSFRFSLPHESVFVAKENQKYTSAVPYSNKKYKALESDMVIMSKNDDNFRKPIEVDNGKCWTKYV